MEFLNKEEQVEIEINEPEKYSLFVNFKKIPQCKRKKSDPIKSSSDIYVRQ